MFMYYKFFIHFLIQTSIDSVYIFLIFIKYYLLLLFYIFLFEESIVNIINFNYFLKNYLINKRKIKKKNHINRLKNLDVILILDEEKIIKGKLIIKAGKIQLITDFDIQLADHDVKIPKVVTKKIAETVAVKVNANFEKK